jgi:hypothetical protein
MLCATFHRIHPGCLIGVIGLADALRQGGAARDRGAATGSPRAL